MFLFLLAVVSLAGVPPLPIFFAKYYLFKELVESGFTGLVIVGAVFSAVSLGYYLNLIKNAFLIEAKEVSVPPVRGYPLLAASLSTLLLLFFVAYLSGFLELLPPA
jgi:NADH-quinone oxidoreductase subunit N